MRKGFWWLIFWGFFSDQEASHHHLMHQRAVKDARTPEKMKRHRSLLSNNQLSMEEKKRKIIRNLRKLESLGLVSSNNQYQDIINMITKVRREVPAGLNFLKSMYGPNVSILEQESTSVSPAWLVRSEEAVVAWSNKKNFC